MDDREDFFRLPVKTVEFSRRSSRHEVLQHANARLAVLLVASVADYRVGSAGRTAPRGWGHGRAKPNGGFGSEGE